MLPRIKPIDLFTIGENNNLHYRVIEEQKGEKYAIDLLADSNKAVIEFLKENFSNRNLPLHFTPEEKIENVIGRYTSPNSDIRGIIYSA